MGRPAAQREILVGQSLPVESANGAFWSLGGFEEVVRVCFFRSFSVFFRVFFVFFDLFLVFFWKGMVFFETLLKFVLLLEGCFFSKSTFLLFYFGLIN